MASLESEADFNIEFTQEELGIAIAEGHAQFDSGSDTDLDLEERHGAGESVSNLGQSDEFVMSVAPTLSTTSAIKGQEVIMHSSKDQLEPLYKSEAETGAENELMLDEDKSTATSAVDEPKTKTNPEATADEPIAAETRLLQAQAAMAWSISTMLTQTPEMTAYLQLHHPGDAATVTATANGTTYEVIWKVVNVSGAPQSLRNAAPLPTGPLPSPAVKCKFGRACKNGAACPYEHTAKAKLCAWVNTPQGCSKSAECEFSHESEGMRCTRSATRKGCANGRGCAFKHSDDGGKIPPTDLKAHGVNENTEPLVGRKRERGLEDEGENASQRRRLADNGEASTSRREGRQHHGQGRSRGYASGRGRGRGRGAADRGQ
jgi:hypothetical protein